MKDIPVTQKKYDRVVYLAVGGSATAGDIVSDWFLSAGGVEVSVFRGSFPKLRLDGSLVIICSTSGETLETLTMAEAVKGHPDVVTISHNGKLKEFAEKQGMGHLDIGMIEAPRFTLPYSLFASVVVLRSAGLLQGMEDDAVEAIAVLKEMKASIGIDNPSEGNASKSLANEIGNKQPCIYASSVTKSVARRFKNSLNENAKIHAEFDSAPDIFHNEIEAWESKDPNYHPVIVRREGDPSSETASFKWFSDFLGSRKFDTSLVEAKGTGNLAQLMSLCYALDFASYYAAILRDTEPFEIGLIDQMKRSR
jgi:glucose/mannose-6-phosphate isomerase